MARRIKAISIEHLKDQSYQVIEISLESGQIQDIKSFKIDAQKNRSGIENLFKKNAGDIVISFPFEKSYYCELELHEQESEKNLAQALTLNREIALPARENACLSFSFKAAENQGKTKYLQFTILEKDFPLFEKIKMGYALSYPSALFQGISHLFAFSKTQTSLLLYQQGDATQLAWGKDGKVEGIRNLSQYHLETWPDLFNQIFSLEGGISHFYSWCDPETSRSLDQMNKKNTWVHLKEKDLPFKLSGYKENIAGICAALSYALGYKNAPVTTETKVGSLFHHSPIKKSLERTVRLLALIGLLLLSLGWVQVQRERETIFSLQQSLKTEFYHIFSSKTPMISPSQQLKEKLIAEKKIRPSLIGISQLRLLKTLASIYQTKPSSISVGKIEFSENVLMLQITSSSDAEARQWNKRLYEAGFKHNRIEPLESGKTENPLQFLLTFYVGEDA